MRYCSYTYFRETGLYYLQSRYYNPEWGRFINADGQLVNDKLTGTNLFVYCNNNPVNYFDPTGEIAVSTVILIGSIVVGVAVAGYTAYVEYQAGIETPQIVCDSIIAGVSAFMLVYSAGMTVYQCYQNYCYLNGLTPVTDISFSSGKHIQQWVGRTPTWLILLTLVQARILPLLKKVRLFSRIGQ